jgi:hypothetical protein
LNKYLGRGCFERGEETNVVFAEMETKHDCWLLQSNLNAQFWRQAIKFAGLHVQANTSKFGDQQ